MKEIGAMAKDLEQKLMMASTKNHAGMIADVLNQTRLEALEEAALKVQMHTTNLKNMDSVSMTLLIDDIAKAIRNLIKPTE